MKIIETNLKKGFVKIIPETFDDLWHLYNIIYEGDEIFARTTRETEQNEEYARPGRDQRISVFLGIQVEKVVLDKLLGRLRVHGIIREGPKTVPIGAHHTISISLNKPLTVVKKKWPNHHIQRLERARKASEKPITIIAIDDEGYAVAITKQYGVEVKVEERTKLPGKREADKRNAATKEYFRKALSSLRYIWMSSHSPIAIIGVGFIKSDFAKFLKAEDKDIAESVVDVKSVNNTGVAGLYEAIRSGVLAKTMKHMRITQEAGVMKEVLKRLGKNEFKIAYGLDQVKKAVELGAVEKIILADDMLRRASDEKRLLLEDIMRTVERKGGEVMIISSEHEAGAKLTALGGVATLLRFPLD